MDTATTSESSSSPPALSSWKRFLETATVVSVYTVFSLATFGPLITLYILFYTKYWFVAVAYISWIVYDRDIGKEGGRSSKFYKNLRIWKYYANYFPIRLIKTAELDPSRNYLLGYHPHGLCVVGNLGNFNSEANNVSHIFPGISTRYLTLNFLFYVPLLREIILMAGGCSVAAESMDFILSKKGGGNAIVIVPGGAREVLDTKPGTNTIYLKKRKGFIRLAIKNGSPLVPIYSFGENDVFEIVDNPEGSIYRKFQEMSMNLFGVFMVFPAFKSHPFGMLPLRRLVTSVVGAPIELEQTENPTQEYIDQIHEKYMSELTALFYANREKCGHPNAELTIK